MQHPPLRISDQSPVETIPPTDPLPPSREQAKTINPGAYFRFLTTGQMSDQNLTLHADTSKMCAMGSQIWTRVDGGPLVQHVLGAPSWDFVIDVPFGPPFSASPNHLVEVIVKSTTETQSRWAPQSTAVVFTHITLADNVVPVQPLRKPYNVLIYGDSITEGVRTLGFEGIPNDTDRNDAVRDYSLQLSKLLYGARFSTRMYARGCRRASCLCSG
jgi:hypothetical protein